MDVASDSLWHVSDDGNIALFRPRVPPERAQGVKTAVVWAVNTARLPNYLVPRCCPRVTFYRMSSTTLGDAAQFSVPVTGQVIVIEDEWLTRLPSANLWLYELPKKQFRCLDENAGYFVSEHAVEPLSKRLVTNLSVELSTRNAVVRSARQLHTLAAEIAASTLGFSIIRLHNARTA